MSKWHDPRTVICIGGRVGHQTPDCGIIEQEEPGQGGAVDEIDRLHKTQFADAEAALDQCAAFGPLGLITDGTHQVQANKVAALGIAPRFARQSCRRSPAPCWRGSACTA